MKHLPNVFICTLVVSAFSILPVSAQTQTWVNQFGNSEHSEFVNGVAADHQGASIVGGRFLGTVAFGEGERQKTSITAKNIDGYIARYGRGGQFHWVQQLIATDHGAADVEDIAVDAKGNIYIAGEYFDELILGYGQPGETTLEASAQNGFVAKYRPNGQLVWAKAILGNDEVFPFGIAVNDKGQVAISGVAYGTYTFGKHEPYEQTVTNLGGFLAVYNAENGQFKWASLLTPESNVSDSNADAVSVDHYGNTYITGYVQGEVTFGKGEANEKTIQDGHYQTSRGDAFIAKYDSYGAFQWVTRITGFNSESGSAIRVGKNAMIYIAGQFSGDVVFGEDSGNQTAYEAFGPLNGFVAKYDGHGAFKWARILGSDDLAGAPGMDINMHGQVLVGGTVRGSLIYFSGTGDDKTYTPDYPHEYGLYGVLLDEYGSVKHTRFNTGTGFLANAVVALDDRGNEWVAGGFSETLLFEPGRLVDGPIKSAGSSDVFLTQYRSHLPPRRDHRDRGRRYAANTDLDTAGKITSSDLPEAFQLSQNYPNPFNPTTTISFALPEAVNNVRLDIYDLTGALVRSLVSGAQEAGYHEVTWNGQDANGRHVVSGTYLYRLQAGDFQVTKAMMMVK